MSQNVIYTDNNATTMVAPEVVEAMNKFGLVPKITTSAELAKSMKEQAVAVEAALIDAGMKKI